MNFCSLFFSRKKAEEWDLFLRLWLHFSFKATRFNFIRRQIKVNFHLNGLAFSRVVQSEEPVRASYTKSTSAKFLWGIIQCYPRQGQIWTNEKSRIVFLPVPFSDLTSCGRSPRSLQKTQNIFLDHNMWNIYTFLNLINNRKEENERLAFMFRPH